MRYVPLLCRGCRHCFLGAALSVATEWPCPACARPARPVPGASYREGDIALFERIQDAVRRAELSPATAAVLRAQLDQPLLGDTPHLQRIKRLSDSLPSAALLEAMIDDQEPGLRKAEGMLTCVLDAFASLGPADGSTNEPGSRSRR